MRGVRMLFAVLSSGPGLPVMKRLPWLLLFPSIGAAALVGCVTRELQVGSRCPEGFERCLPDGAVPEPDAVVPFDAASDVSSDACAGDCGRAPEASQLKASKCVPGLYAGSFHMSRYKPVAAGVCGLATLLGEPGGGSWQFVIPESVEKERSDVVQVDTCLDLDIVAPDIPVPPDAGAHPYRLRTAMHATLDCETGALEAEIKGAYYSLALCYPLAAAWFSVKGFVEGTLAAEGDGVVEGRVELWEPPSLLPLPQQLSPPPGGEGVWRATRVPADADRPPTENCLQGVEFSDFEVTP